MNAKLLAAGIVATLASLAAQAETLTVAGSTTVQKRILEPGAGALKAATGIDVKVLGTGTGKGMIALFEGKVPVAAASESLPEAVASAQKAALEAGKSISVPGNLQFHELFTDTIAVIVSPENPLLTLTREQIKDLHTGKIRNWQEIGGANRPVKVVTSHGGSATRAVFQTQVMDGADYVPSALEVRTTREEITEVAREPGAIGAVSEGFVAQNPGQVKVVKAPAISRPLALVTVGDAKPEVRKIVDFFKSAEGQKHIE